uniref:hypothetical protein n=1 Tax=Escherichia coli TaxID=562 RepID=UPI00197C8EC5
QKKLIMLPSETMIWQPEFTDKILSRKPGAVQILLFVIQKQFSEKDIQQQVASHLHQEIGDIR